MENFICPNCYQEYGYDPVFEDKNILCLNCNKIFTCKSISKAPLKLDRTIIIPQKAKITKSILLHLPLYQEFEQKITTKQFNRILELSPTIDLSETRGLDEKQARLVITQLEHAKIQYRDSEIEGIYINKYDLMGFSEDMVGENCSF